MLDRHRPARVEHRCGTRPDLRCADAAHHRPSRPPTVGTARLVQVRHSALPWSALLVVLLLAAGTARGQDLRFIPLPPSASPRDLLYNPISNKLYTANTPQAGAPSSESVTIIDGAKDAVIRTITVAAGPRDFCLNTRSNRVYVANYFADSVTVIDGETDEIIAVIAVGDGPRALCYNERDDRVYCANEFSGSVTVIDGASHAVTATVTVGSTPRVICYNPISNKATRRTRRRSASRRCRA